MGPCDPTSLLMILVAQRVWATQAAVTQPTADAAGTGMCQELGLGHAGNWDVSGSGMRPARREPLAVTKPYGGGGGWYVSQQGPLWVDVAPAHASSSVAVVGSEEPGT